MLLIVGRRPLGDAPAQPQRRRHRPRRSAQHDMTSSFHDPDQPDQLAALRSGRSAAPVVIDASFDLADTATRRTRVTAGAHARARIYAAPRPRPEQRQDRPQRPPSAARARRLRAHRRRGSASRRARRWSRSTRRAACTRRACGGCCAGSVTPTSPCSTAASRPGSAAAARSRPTPSASPSRAALPRSADAAPTVDAGGVADAAAPRVAVLDARSGERFRGEVEPIDARRRPHPGRPQPLPSRPTSTTDGAFKPPAAAARRVRGRPRRPPRRGEVIHSCGSGVTACHNLLAMEHAGLAGSLLYPGSWSEWSSDPGAADRQGLGAVGAGSRAIPVAAAPAPVRRSRRQPEESRCSSESSFRPTARRSPAAPSPPARAWPSRSAPRCSRSASRSRSPTAPSPRCSRRRRRNSSTRRSAARRATCAPSSRPATPPASSAMPQTIEGLQPWEAIVDHAAEQQLRPARHGLARAQRPGLAVPRQRDAGRAEAHHDAGARRPLARSRAASRGAQRAARWSESRYICRIAVAYRRCSACSGIGAMRVNGSGSGFVSGCGEVRARSGVPSVVARADAAAVVAEQKREAGRGPMHVRQVIARQRDAAAPVERAAHAFELREDEGDHRFEVAEIARARRLAERCRGRP